MKKRDIVLTGILLVLIGVLIGLIISMVQPDSWGRDFAELRVTEVQRSSQPAVNVDDLEGFDARFLFRKIADEVTPAVVYIETTVQMSGGGGYEDEGGDSGIWERFMPRRARTVGSGVIISEDGYILTNNHVIEGAVGDGIHVTLNDKRSFPARIVGTDPSTDLAVIRIQADNIQPVILGNSDVISVGEWVLAIGNPFRLRSTVTAGIVSALSRDVQIINDSHRIESFIQTDAAINRGNSGGALVNTSGELVGINTAIATQSGNYQGYGFAVPSNLALKVAGDLMEFGEVRRGMIGIGIESVNHSIARDLNMDQIRGVWIVETPRGGAAYDAGIRRNDVVLEVEGSEVNEANQLQEKVAMYRPGDTISLTLWRDGEILTRDVILRAPELTAQDLYDEFEVPGPELDPDDGGDPTLPPQGEHPEDYDDYGERPEDYGIEQQSFEFGFTIQAIPGLSDDGYELLVESVERGTEAWNRGLRPEYQILEVDDQPVDSLSELEQMINNSDNPVTLKTRTPEAVIIYVVLVK